VSSFIEILAGFGVLFCSLLALAVALTILGWLFCTEEGAEVLACILLVVLVVGGPIACTSMSHDIGHSILAKKASRP
jgi:hypothetical protein